MNRKTIKQGAPQENKGMSGSALKLIAMVTMIIDHFAVVFIGNNIKQELTLWHGLLLSKEQRYYLYLSLRCIGRIAFPIFCFLLIEGAMHTRNKRNYVLRLFLFALLSEVPFDLAVNQSVVDITSQNVFFTLGLGLMAIYAMQKWGERSLCSWMLAVLACGLAEGMHSDYGFSGVIMIVIFWLFREQEILRVVVCGVWCIVAMGNVEAFAVMAFLPIHYYNGKRGIPFKYGFYAVYPIHLFVLWMIHVLYF